MMCLHCNIQFKSNNTLIFIYFLFVCLFMEKWLYSRRNNIILKCEFLPFYYLLVQFNMFHHFFLPFRFFFFCLCWFQLIKYNFLRLQIQLKRKIIPTFGICDVEHFFIRSDNLRRNWRFQNKFSKIRVNNV